MRLPSGPRTESTPNTGVGTQGGVNRTAPDPLNELDALPEAVRTMRRPVLPSLATLVALSLLAAAPALADPPPHAKAWGHKSRQAEREYYDRRYDDRYYERRYSERYYDDRRDRERHLDDVRYYAGRHRHDRDCDHYDARRVVVVERLPYGHRYIDHRGHRYYYDRRGQWYEPYGAAYVHIAPPAGIVIDSRGIAVVANVPIVRW